MVQQPSVAGRGGHMQDKVAIVTGAASGFGRAIALRFAAEGARVLVGDLDVKGAEETVRSIVASSTWSSSSSSLASTVPASESGGGTQGNIPAFAQVMDVTSEEAWREAVGSCVERWGRLDCVVNNAGTSYKNKPTLDVTEAEFERCFTVNVKSIFWSVKAAVPELRRGGRGGSIVNISSIGSVRPRPGLVWYNSSKGAVSNATKGLASEYGADGIRVNAICPLLCGTGLFETFVGVPFTEENVASFVGAVPLGRLTEVEDVANMALFLASEEGRFITGQNLQVDGGKGI